MPKTKLTDDQAREHLAANVTRLRRERSKSWLARQVGTYAIHITRIEAGECLPSAGLLMRLAQALDVSTDSLLAPPRKKKKSRA